MRRTRWLILAAICLILFTVGSTYIASVERARREAPAPARPLKEGVEGTAEGWHYSHNEGGCPVFEARAKNFEQVTEPASFNLQDVALQLFRECGKSADQVKSAKAQFDVASGVMFSEGEVEITMGVPTDENAPKGRLLKIISSGVRFETKTGKASTDKEARFSFDQGEGQAVGAEYDPSTRELHLKSAIDLNWRGRNAKSTPMRIETADLVYRERNSQVALSPWAKLTRDTLHMDSGPAFVTLDEGIIRLVQAQNAHGIQSDPGRTVDYAADSLTMTMDENGQVTKIEGTNNARLNSATDTAKTEVTSDSAVMAFAASDHESILTNAIATGKANVKSTPILKKGAPPQDTRILRSEMIEIRMRDGGKEIDNVETHAPGALEFVPNQPGRPHRFLNGDTILIAYGPENAIDNFKSTSVQTRTENPPRKAGEKRPPVLTWSRDLLAKFDPKTQQLSTLEQNVDFRYQEGDRKAKSDRATLEEATDRMTLTGSARVSDPTGSTMADKIVMNQKSGDVIADGHVNSSRLPDKKKDSNPALLSGDEPMQAKSDRMTTAGNNDHIHYEGHAVAWQGANRIEADQIDFDRKDRVMRANGKVVSYLVDKSDQTGNGKTAAPKEKQAPVFTVVRAPSLVYTDANRLAHYTGGAVMVRPNLNVKAREIQAYLKEADKDGNDDSSLDKAIADGGVVIDQSSPGRKRVSSSEHAEYYATEGKIVLTGGQPQMVDSVKGTTKGRELTYYTNDDRLLVNGVESQRAESVIRRKK